MKYYVRVFGWLFLGMGSVLSVLTLLDMSGLVDVSGNFFGIEVDTDRERAIWLAACLVGAATGLALLRLTRRARQAQSGP